MTDIRIRCPKCDWEPHASSKWRCSCNMVWNTFDTAGRCPQCKRIWKETQCASCHEWSDHLDWYEGLDEIILRLKEEIEKSWANPVEH